jgi:hypothetical protein
MNRDGLQEHALSEVEVEFHPTWWMIKKVSLAANYVLGDVFAYWSVRLKAKFLSRSTIVVQALRDMHSMNAYNAGHVCPSACFRRRSAWMNFEEISYHEKIIVPCHPSFNVSLLCACLFPITLWYHTQVRKITWDLCVISFTSAKNVCVVYHIVYGFVS